MKRSIWFALVLLGCLATGPHLCAQIQSNGNGAGQPQPKPGAQQQAQPAGSNPFPEDMNSIPVLPAKTGADGSVSAPDSGAGYSSLALPSEDLDPARSPDDPVGGPSAQDSNFSSSLSGMDRVLPGPDDEPTNQKRKLTAKEPTHKEAASKDIEVGGYYLERKNWKAAESRFESAMVLDPDNPDVFWGLAESAKNLGHFADAKKYYQTVVDYDPDSKHGKEAKKALKEPEVANARVAVPVGETPK